MNNNEFIDHNEYLEEDDVIAFTSDSMCKVSRFKELFLDFAINKMCNQLVEYLQQRGFQCVHIVNHKHSSNGSWITHGKECDILKVNSHGWKKGKIRLKVSLEFIPDEPEINEIESPLDDIRQSMN